MVMTSERLDVGNDRLGVYLIYPFTRISRVRGLGYKNLSDRWLSMTQHEYKRRSSRVDRRASKRDLSIWEKCRICADQMFGGPLCFTHNPTVEQRATTTFGNGTQTTNE